MQQLPSDIVNLLRKLELYPSEAKSLTGSGSPRKYWRLKFPAGPDLIATQGTNKLENEAFLYLDRKLSEANVKVPEPIGVSDNRMAYVQTDVGQISLFDCLDRTDLIGYAIDMLALAQQTPGINYSKCFPVAKFDRRSIMWDLNYFKYCFLKTCTDIEIDEPTLEEEFESIAGKVLNVKPWGLMLRDFQSRNVMVNDNQVAFIDFQGGRKGPAHYDVASFLWQARAKFTEELKDHMIGRFCKARKINEQIFRAELPYFVALRLMQALGAYGLRGRFEQKEHFLLSIPPAVESLRNVLASTDLPYLQGLLAQRLY